MVAHIDREKTKGFRGGIKCEIVHFDKVKIRVEGRAVIFPSRIVDSLSQGNRSLSEKAFTCPGFPEGLPGTHGG